MKHEFICIVCPRGCSLKVEREDAVLKVTGAGCRRGEQFAKEEVTAPKRNLTTTVQTTCENQPRLSVRTNRPIPKELLLQASARLVEAVVSPPIHRGDVVVSDILGTGADIVASMDMLDLDGGQQEVI